MNREPYYVPFWEAVSFFGVCENTLKRWINQKRIAVVFSVTKKPHAKNKFIGLMCDIESLTDIRPGETHYFDSPTLKRLRDNYKIKQMGSPKPYKCKKPRMIKEPKVKLVKPEKIKKTKPLKVESIDPTNFSMIGLPLYKYVKEEEKCPNVFDLAWG